MTTPIEDKWYFYESLINQAQMIETDRTCLPLSESQVNTIQIAIEKLQARLATLVPLLETIPTGENSGQQGFQNILICFDAVDKQLVHLERRINSVSEKGVETHTGIIEEAEALAARIKQMELEEKSRKEFDNLLANFAQLTLEDQRKYFNELNNLRNERNSEKDKTVDQSGSDVPEGRTSP